MKKTFSLLLVIAMIACMLPVFTFAVSAAESINVPIAKTANGWTVTGQPTENKGWTVSDTELSLNAGFDQGYYVFDMAVPAGKITSRFASNQASGSCSGIIFCLTDVDNDRAFWEGDDMSCYWLFVDENNKVRLSEVGKHGGNPGWHELIGGGDQVDLDDKGIDVTVGFELTVEWDGKGMIKAYVNGELINTVDDTASPMTGSLCGVRMKQKDRKDELGDQPWNNISSGAVFTSIEIEPAVVEITTAEEFLSIENNLDGNYKLMNDITITEGLSYKEEGKRFSGTFDGNGKTITLDFVDKEWARSGLFCSVEGTNVVIKNLNVTGKLESNGNSTGVVIGTINGDNSVVTIENVTTDISFKADNSTNGQGGIIGCVENNGTVNLIGCTSKGDIIGEVAGGLIGAVVHDSKINITNCTNEGDITSTNLYADYRGAGGFIGKVQNGNTNITLKNSTNKGDVTAKFVVANAYVGHNNSWNYVVEGCTNTGKVISGGLELPADTAVARDQGIWGDAGFGFNFSNGELKGSPRFHSNPSLNGWKAYINGVEATDKVTVKYVMKADKPAEQEDRKVEIVAMCNGLYDGYASVTIIWEDGKYSTFGANAPTKADADQIHESADLIGKLTEATVDTGSVSAENPLLANGFEDNPTPHGSEGNLFDADVNNKYEGWHVLGSGSLFVNFQLTEATAVTHYALGTGNDDAAFPDRQPAEWKLWASVDGNDYVLLDHVKGDSLPNVSNKLAAFELDTDGTAYKFFKLEVVSFISEAGREVPPAGERAQGVYVQIGQIKLYSCEHNYVDNVCTNCGHDINAPETTPETNVPKTGDAVLAISALALLAAAAAVAVARRRKNED